MDFHSRDDDIAARRLDFSSRIWQFFPKFPIYVVFVTHAAHKSSADPGDLRRIESQVLLFYHLDAYRRKLVEPVTAAAGLPAGTESPDDLGLIPHSDLPLTHGAVEKSGRFRLSGNRLLF